MFLLSFHDDATLFSLQITIMFTIFVLSILESSIKWLLFTEIKEELSCHGLPCITHRVSLKKLTSVSVIWIYFLALSIILLSAND